MEGIEPLLELLEQAALATRLRAASADHESRFAADPQLAVSRSLLVDRAACAWGEQRLRSVWLLSQRPLRRLGFRRHPGSLQVLLAWRGEGLVLLRPPGERLSATLVPWDRTEGADTMRHVVVAAGTLHDTLADMAVWHLVSFHTQSASDLVREQQTEEGFVAYPEGT